MMHYRDWTAQQVRDWIEEAAATADKLPGRYGPRGDGNAFHETVREKWKDAAPNTPTMSRPSPSPFALARMEQAWSWINALEREEERRLLYDWSAAKALGKGYLGAVIARSGYAERTFRHAVTRVCQRIADTLNRKHEIRLTMPVDVPAVMGDPVHEFSVASSNCAKVAKQPRHTPPADTLHHDRSLEGHEAFRKHLARVNRRRQNQARRKAARKQAKQKAA